MTNGVPQGWHCDLRCSASWLTRWMVGLGASLASLLTTPSCAVWLICCREGMPSRGILTHMRGEPVPGS